MKIFIIILISFIPFLLISDITPQNEKNLDIGNTENQNLTGSKSELHNIKANQDDAKKLVYEAVDYIDKYGKNQAFKEFSDPTGRFCYKDTYIFAIDMAGNVLAHGGDTGLIGSNQYDLKDSVGKYFIQEFINLMQQEEEGWNKYKWHNYDTFEIETKLTFLKRYDQNLFLGCGIYCGN